MSYSGSKTTSPRENSNHPGALCAGNFPRCCFLLPVLPNAAPAAIGTALLRGRQPLCSQSHSQAPGAAWLTGTAHAGRGGAARCASVPARGTAGDGSSCLAGPCSTLTLYRDPEKRLGSYFLQQCFHQQLIIFGKESAKYSSELLSLHDDLRVLHIRSASLTFHEKHLYVPN